MSNHKTSGLIPYFLAIHLTTYRGGRLLAKSSLKKHIPNYSKNDDIYATLKPLLTTAIKHAKKIEVFQLDDSKTLTTVACNPYTNVYKIIDELNRKNCIVE